MHQDQFEEDKLVPKWKVALIPILGVVLVIILIPKADAKQEAPGTTSLALNPDVSEKGESGADLSELPTGSLSSASQFNPFKMGEPLLRLTMGAPEEAGPSPEEIAAQQKKEKEAEERKKKKLALMESIKNLNVSLIVQTETGVAAIIDSRTVHVGDEIQPGVIVTYIGNDGLKVSLKNRENTQAGKEPTEGHSPPLQTSD